MQKDFQASIALNLVRIKTWLFLQMAIFQKLRCKLKIPGNGGWMCPSPLLKRLNVTDCSSIFLFA
jgi:hypothetical protein